MGTMNRGDTTGNSTAGATIGTTIERKRDSGPMTQPSRRDRVRGRLDPLFAGEMLTANSGLLSRGCDRLDVTGHQGVDRGLDALTDGLGRRRPLRRGRGRGDVAGHLVS